MTGTLAPMFMNSTRLATLLLAFGLALSAILSTQTAYALADPVDYGSPATDANGAVYCVSSYVESQYPGCVPPPLPTKTYKGQPVSVEDAKNIPWGTMRTSVNVLRNDAIQKRSKIREIELIGQRPEMTGLRTWVYKKKVWFEMKSGQHLGFLGGGLGGISYRVIDAKGRASYPVYVSLRVK